MTHNQNTHKPPVTDLWLLVDEEQTMHFGMRRTWRWLETEQPVRRATSQAAVAHSSSTHAPVCCQPVQVVCAI